MQLSLLLRPDQLAAVTAAQRCDQLEALGVSAELHGFSTIWMMPAPVTASSTTQTRLRTLWRLSAVTETIQLGAVLTVALAEQPDRLVHEIGTLVASTGARIRIAVRVVVPVTDQASERSHRANKARLQVWCDALQQATTGQRQNLLGSHRTSAARAISPPVVLIAHPATAALTAAQNTACMILSDYIDDPSTQTAAYRHAHDGQQRDLIFHCQVAISSTDQRIAPVYRSYQSRVELREPVIGHTWLGSAIGTPEHVAVTLVMHQLAIDSTEIVCEVVGHGGNQREWLRQITLIGNEVLPHIARQSPPLVSASAAHVA